MHKSLDTDVTMVTKIQYIKIREDISIEKFWWGKFSSKFRDFPK